MQPVLSFCSVPCILPSLALEWQQERVPVIISIKCGKLRSVHFLQSVLTLVIRAIRPVLMIVGKQMLHFTLRVSCLSLSTVRFRVGAPPVGARVAGPLIDDKWATNTISWSYW